MKKLISTAALLISTSAFAGTAQLEAKYEVYEGQAQCRQVNCNEEGICDTRIYFSEESWTAIQAKGFAKRRFGKHPEEICKAGELPMSEAEYGPIKVLLYTVDLEPLDALLK